MPLLGDIMSDREKFLEMLLDSEGYTEAFASNPNLIFTQEEFEILENHINNQDLLNTIAKKNSVFTYEERENFLDRPSMTWKEFFENYDCWES